jgi:hypothetical protein
VQAQFYNNLYGARNYVHQIKDCYSREIDKVCESAVVCPTIYPGEKLPMSSNTEAALLEEKNTEIFSAMPSMISGSDIRLVPANFYVDCSICGPSSNSHLLKLFPNLQMLLSGFH